MRIDMGRELAGTMRERVELLTPTAARDALGGGQEDWTVVDVVWASCRPTGQGPAFAGDARAALPTWEVVLRPCPVKVGDRIDRVHGSLLVTGVVADPATPDRITCTAERVR